MRGASAELVGHVFIVATDVYDGCLWPQSISLLSIAKTIYIVYKYNTIFGNSYYKDKYDM